MNKVSIITIGDELLIGQVIDTNSAWIAQELSKYGIAVGRRVAIGDDSEAINSALAEEANYSDIILITGGLGPTADDITKPTLCRFFNGKLVRNDEALRNVERLFSEVFKREITERNILQADVPDVCEVMQNTVGTAPGMIFNKDGKVFMSMPGVPHEMKHMVRRSVIPYLLHKFSFPFIIHRTLITFGVGESTIADMLTDFEDNLPDHVKLAYLPNYGLVRLRLSATGRDEKTLVDEVEKQSLSLQALVAEYMIATEDMPMQNLLAGSLSANNETLCAAESCTGGYIAHLLTQIPGASAWFDGSAVTYSYKAKQDILGVSKTTLMNFGAVSEEVVREMAAGALKRFRTTYTIAVSGIMGPGGGMPDKPVGMVWVAVGNNDQIVTKCFQFRFDRKKNIELTAMNAMNLLRAFITKTNKK